MLYCSGAPEVTGLVTVKGAYGLERRLIVGEVKCCKFANVIYIAVSKS